MVLSNYLAELWGLSLVVVCLSLLIKTKYLRRLFASLEDSNNLFCWGLCSFVIGTASVLGHNIWVKDWRVVVTIFGWIGLIKGLTLLFTPELTIKWVRKMENASFLPFTLVIGVFIGLALTYFGFTA